VKCGLLRGSEAPAESAESQAWSPIAPPKPGVLGGLLRRFGWIGVVAAFGIGAALVQAGRDDSGVITKGGSLAISELKVGDCFNQQDPDAEEANEVDAKPCDDGHEFELIFVGAMPDGAYPIQTDFENYVGGACLPAFDEYVGMAYEQSRLEVYWYFPVEAGWDQGDHTIQCAIYDPDDSEIVGSLRGAAY
jgi:hypothetical protein